MIFTAFDTITFSIIAISSLLGIYRGAIQITVNLIGFVISAIFAVAIYPYTRIIVTGYVSSDVIISVISGTLSYIISLIIFTLLCSKIVCLFSAVSRSTTDRLIGLGLGFVRGVAFMVIAFFVVAVFTGNIYSKSDIVRDLVLKISAEDYPEWLSESVAVPYLEKILKDGVKILPLNELLNIKLPKLKKEVDNDLMKKTLEEKASEEVRKNIKDKIPVEQEKDIKN